MALSVNAVWSVASETIFLPPNFSSRIDFRLRHYWQQVEYDGFRELIDEGVFNETDYNPLDEEGLSVHNTNYNAFTLDVNFR